MREFERLPLDPIGAVTYRRRLPGGEGARSVEYRVLGSLEVVSDGAKPDLGPPKQRALLAALILHANEIVATDRLIDLLWADRPPRTASHSIQIYVSELRKAIAPLTRDQVIVTRSPGYRLEAEPDSIDARRFERLLDEATAALRGGDPTEGTAKLREAMALWRGPALSEFAYEEFAQSEIRRLTDLRLAGLEELAAVELGAGRTAQALSVLETAIREDPLRERLRELLMLALYRSGRHAEALRTYEAFRTKLAEEMGLDPSPPLRRLQERILLHDAGLAPIETPPAEPVAARNPYKGLRPFGEQDAGDFFGRTSLAEHVLDALRDGSRLVALVGPSGSGKSSVVAAGVIPGLREGALSGSGRWEIATFAPGPHPLEELETAVVRAREDRPLLLVIDQFEEVFSLTAEPERERFLGALAEAVTDPSGRVRALLTLRADFYGAPLLEPGFAEVFTSGVVNVLPMSAQELGEAVTGPAERVGVPVEAALVAELIGETAGRPGALPLLQFALTELFEREGGDRLTLEAYRELGGVRGVVSRRAEELYASLNADEQRIAMQAFLRLIRLGQGTDDARRRVPLAELTALDLDPVALSAVLDGFGRHRLLSFDREPASGAATVEVAHESLLWEWDRLAGWIEQHRAALRKHAPFLAAVEEWEASGRDPDYLLTGSRLAEHEAWSRDSPLLLTGGERAFLEAGLERRRVQEAEDVARLDLERRLERRARSRLIALLAAVVMLVGVTTFGVLTWLGNRPPDVLHVDTRSSGIFGDMIATGVDRAVADLGMRNERVLHPGPEIGPDDLVRYAESAGVVVLTWVDCGLLDQVSREHPDTRFVIFDGCPDGWPNVANGMFAAEQGSYLAGAAAALKSETGIVGFIGADPNPVIWPFRAGFEAGAKAVDPTVEVRTTYLSELIDGAANPYDAEPIAFQVATEMYEEGVDVIFPAAGASAFGVFEAALQHSGSSGRHVWAIGVDVDQYAPGSDRYSPHILTSVVKRYDEAVYALLSEYAHGTLVTGNRLFDLASGGVGVTYSGGFIEPFRPRLEALEADIVAGRIEVPCVPPEHMDELAGFGLDPADPCAVPV